MFFNTINLNFTLSYSKLNIVDEIYDKERTDTRKNIGIIHDYLRK